ncbi:Asp-tRNA(Asn)/Glu-tRNA(Gln) amidotransferase subunit GatC [Anaerophilus nitritogenes]|uniref:Asp-tRNA(Asn)/Glu-tRNA(Gln) amidotransferase subunit GatC n=1 Tax=Anaerophilus nitritogenes TaxID=2498136 RepID=UPI0013EA0C38|nr:Asp-tRNA(Asn)/Glu-tRNA(Gln) amidotransferase subunit GatC [Anaerophilus nitritogenes]
MNIDDIAALSKIKLSEYEKEKMIDDFNRTIDFVDKLKEVNVDKVAPTYHILHIKNVYREDKILPSMKQDEVLKNAPEKNNGYFQVPKMME